jgi:hypothetical protein
MPRGLCRLSGFGIYERTRRKAIPHRKLGKFVRFTEEDLRTIVEAVAKGTMQ